MKNDSLVYGVIGGVIGIIIGVFLASNAVNNNITGMMRMMGMRSTNIQSDTMMSTNMDQHFIEQMIPHHEDAITMARFAQEKAKRPEIKNLANAIVDAQSTEIDDMKNRYEDWYGEEVPQDKNVMGGHGMMGKSGTHMGMMGDETDMVRLENAADFDKAFIEEMIPHHQMAVMMATMLKNGTQRNEMRELADNIIQSQSDEIDQMREWYGQWYQ